MELAVKMVKEEEAKTVMVKAKDLAEEKLLDYLLPPPVPQTYTPVKEGEPAREAESPKATREKLRVLLREGKLEDKEIEIESAEQQRMPMVEIFTSQGVEEMDMNMKDMFSNIFPKKVKRRKFKVSEAREIIAQEEAQKLVDMDKVSRGAVERGEQSGIVFIDEIGKIAGKRSGEGPDG